MMYSFTIDPFYGKSDYQCVSEIEKILKDAGREDLIPVFDSDACLCDNVKELCKLYFDKFWFYSKEVY